MAVRDLVRLLVSALCSLLAVTIVLFAAYMCGVPIIERDFTNAFPYFFAACLGAIAFIAAFAGLSS